MSAAQISATTGNIDVIVESAQWDALPDAQAVVCSAIAQALAALMRRPDAALAVLLTDDAAIRRLNATWRGLDKPTNVLSFTAAEAPDSQHLGDIAIAFETTAREAADE